ncbi:MAG TPA: hypothetical protein VGI45_15130 [Terracidiphilus sp.]|jgi:hypothetical protein
MCPFCLATAAVIASSATGTGGVTAFIAGTILKRNKQRILPQNEEKEVNHGNRDDTGKDTENRLSQ